MAYGELRRPRGAQRFTALCLLVTTATGCSLSETTTTVRSIPEATTQRLRLTREGTSPLLGSFRRDGHAVSGHLSLTGGCSAESERVVHRQEVSERRTKRPAAVTWVVVGSAIAALGTGLMVASKSADKRVFCGDGSDAIKAGDRCDSMSSAEMDAGFALLVSGLATATTGGIFLAMKPQVETKDMPPQQVTQVTAPVSCGSTSALDGLVVALELPHNGRWTGRVAADGSVRIDINDQIALPERTTLPVVVELVPPSLAGLVSPGAAVGELTLLSGHLDSSHRTVARRH